MGVVGAFVSVQLYEYKKGQACSLIFRVKLCVMCHVCMSVCGLCACQNLEGKEGRKERGLYNV